MNTENPQRQNKLDRFVIEKISGFFKVKSLIFLAIVTILADIFWIHMYDLNRFLEGGFWWSFFGFSLLFILSTYKHNLVDLVKRFRNETLMEKSNQLNYSNWRQFPEYISDILKIYKNNFDELVERFRNKDLIRETDQIMLYSNWWRIPAYIFWYSYFIYYSIYVFDLDGNNLIDAFINFSFVYKIGLLIYVFSWVAVALPMICDGFGIIPIFWRLSKILFKEYETKENTTLKINLFHADKCAGFKPLGNFVFKFSLLIGLPFIIGMPIRIYVLNKTGLLTLTGIINDAFSMAFLGVGFASSVLFIKSSYYIYQKIEEHKSKKLDEISKELKECYITLENLNREKSTNEVELNYLSNRINLLDNEIKKINEVKLAPWGENRVKEFYSIVFIPTTTTLIGTILKSSGFIFFR